MKQFVIDISIALIGGAAVGWLTNALAVSMLFKKFLGRWGGVIEEQYEAFIENMSALVEADLVNSHTLAATLNSPGFTQTLQNVVETLLMETLPGRSGELRLEELPDIERSLSRLLAQMQEVAPPGEKVYQLLAQQPLTGILSETQYQYMTHKVLKTLEGEGFFAEELRQGLYGFLSRLTPVDMAGEETLKRLGDNLGKQIRQTDFSRFDAPLDHAFEAVLTALDPDRLMEALQTALGAMTLGDFVSPAQVRKTLAPDLIRRCIAVSASKEGSALLLALMSALLAEAKTITLTLEDLLSPTVKAGIRAFIRERLPPLIEEIVALIRECEGEIEAIVNRSIEEELAANPLGGMFMVFKDLFMQNSARKWHIIDKLVVAVYQYGNEAGEKLTQVVLDYLRTTSIGSILTTLEAQKVLTPERMAAGFIRLLETQDGKPQPVLEDLLHRPLDRFVVTDLQILKTRASHHLWELTKHRYLYTHRAKTDLASRLTGGLSRLGEKPLGGLCQAAAWPLRIEAAHLGRALSGLWLRLRGLTLSRLVPPGALKDLSLAGDALWHTHKATPLKALYRKLQKPPVYKRLAAGIHQALQSHADRLMSGRIQALVRGELKKSSPKEINRMVQDFMGSELKPINTLGAVLGAAAGGLSAWISFRLAVPRDFSPGLLLAYGGLFALVGMGTNWIAIQMLFRPYGPRKTLPNCSPFVGVVPAKKSAFAKNIAQFVTQRTMNEEMIREYSGEHRGALEEAIRLWISAEDYGVVGRVLAAPALGEALSQTLLARRAELAGPLSQAVLAGLSTEALPQALRDRLLQVLGEERTAQALAALLREGLVGKTLGPWVEVSLPLLDRGLELALHTLAREADAPRLSAWLWASEDLQARFHRWTEKTTLEDLLGPARMEVLGAVLATGAQELLQKGLESILRDLEREVLHPQTPLKDLFGGILTVQLRHGGMALLEVLAKEMVAQKAAIKRNIKAEMTGLAALGRGQVDPVVDRLIDKELPAFLRRKEARILGIAETLLEHNLASLGFTPEALDTTALTQALSAVIAVPQIQDTLTRYVRLLLAQYGRLPISVLLALIKQPTLHDLLTAGEPLVTALLEVVKPRLTQGEIIRPVLRVFHRVLRDISAETSLEPLLEGLDLEPLVRGLIRRALEDREFRPWFSALLLRVLEGLQKIPDLCDPEQLREDLRVVLSGDDGAALIALWLPALRATLSQANQALTPETKAAFCGDYLIPAALDAGEARLQEILTALDIQRVVEEKVNAMDPRQIESLFYGFAGDYFRKIILYGWIGVFGGLGSYLISALLQFLF